MGSTLRGVFGHALRDTVCVCGQPENHASDCPYRSIFHAPPHSQLNISHKNTPPQAYVIEPPFPSKTQFQAGETYAFDMVLVGQIQQLLPLIVGAWQLAFQRGIGKEKGIGTLQSVAIQIDDEWKNLKNNQYFSIQQATFKLPEQFASHYVMNLQTPLRIQQQGKLCRVHDLNANVVLRQVMRRVSIMTQLYGGLHLAVDFGDLVQTIEKIDFTPELFWYENTRYSNRQHQYIPLGGALGTIYLRDVPTEWAILLYIGQWLHIGKETVFGLGKYALTAV